MGASRTPTEVHPLRREIQHEDPRCRLGGPRWRDSGQRAVHDREQDCFPEADSLGRHGPTTGGGCLYADQCNAGSTFLGTDSLAGVPWFIGTTGSEHQNEPLCFAFDTSGITDDVWFDWTAANTG